MALNLKELVNPATTALVTQEVQNGVVGEGSALAELVAAAKLAIPNMARLVDVARNAGMPVIHCLAERRADARGANTNGRIFQYMAKAKLQLIPGSHAAELVPEIKTAASDIVMTRLHGLSPFQGTELDYVLRNLGVTTIVGVGVSVNVAIQNFAFDAVNASYQMVIPRDAVAGFPQEYVDAVFANTLGAVATLVTTDELVELWST